MHDPEKLMNTLSNELDQALAKMAKAKSLDDKVKYSLVVKNLSSALGVFLNLVTEMMDYDGLDDYDEDDEGGIPF